MKPGRDVQSFIWPPVSKINLWNYSKPSINQTNLVEMPDSLSEHSVYLIVRVSL